MATQADLSPEEWTTLVQTPMTVSAYISLASPSVGDMPKESMALAKRLSALVTDPAAPQIMKELAAEYQNRDSMKAAQPKLDAQDIAGARAQLLDSIATGVALIDATTGADAAGIKQWLYGLAVGTAEAAKEGDFMGIGGEQVNDAERSALAELAGLLGVGA
jgi:hypothetical protein